MRNCEQRFNPEASSGNFSGPLVYFAQIDSFEMPVTEMMENNLRGFRSGGVSQLFKRT